MAYFAADANTGKPLTCVQSILLSNGWELQLCFRDVARMETQALLPIPRSGPATLPGVTLPQTA
jgi:hypothetical protein